MSDNITLPREVVERARKALKPLDYYMTVYDRYEIADSLFTALAAEPTKQEPESKTPAWWMDGLAATLMREGVNKHRAREIAVGYWEAYCQIAAPPALAAEQPKQEPPKQEALCWFCHGTGYQKNPVYPALVPCPNCKPKEYFK